MSDFYFRALLPVLWAVVATVVALLLYRTSSAFFEERQTHEGRNRRIRLVGSVVIAAVVFLGLRWATPKAMLTGLAADQAAVSRQGLDGMKASLGGVSDALDRLDACRSIAPPAECGAQVESVRAQLGDAQRKLGEMTPRAGAAR